MKLTRCLSGLVRALSMQSRPYTAAVLLAGGVGSRMNNTGGPTKQWMMLDGKPILYHAIKAFEDCPYIDEIVVVCRREEMKAAAELVRTYGFSKVRRIVVGGKTRQHSAYNGAKRVSEGIKYIAIHDVARCLVTPDDICAAVSAAYSYRAAMLVGPVQDTIKRVGRDGFIRETVDREELRCGQTPQVFALPLYIGAASAALKSGYTVTDDSMLLEHIGHRVRVIEAKDENFKITTPADLEVAEALLSRRKGKKKKENS